MELIIVVVELKVAECTSIPCHLLLVKSVRFSEFPFH